jgi:hypothetical protein
MTTAVFLKTRKCTGRMRCLVFSPLPFATPWQGDPRVNIQNDKEMTKPYQVRQVLTPAEDM